MKKTDISWNKCKSIVKTVYKECAKSVLFWSFLFLFLYLLLDFYNIPSFAGFRIKDINTDLLGIIVGAMTGFLVFYYTYRFVESWNVTKNKNLREVGYKLISESLESCEKLYITLDKELIQIISKMNDEIKNRSVESPINRYVNTAFENEKIVFQCAIQGVMSPEIIIQYYELKSAFSTYCTMAVMFRDSPEVVLSTKEHLIKQLKIVKKLLDAESNEVK